MSIKINLQIRRLPDIDLIDFGVIDTRLLCDVRFKILDKGNIEIPISAIIDTGAPMSIIPSSIWPRCETKIIKDEDYVSGIIPGPDHMMKTKIGIISAELWDKFGHHYPISFHAHFAPIKEAPFVLGFQDVLEKSILHVDVKGDKCWLEFR